MVNTHHHLKLDEEIVSDDFTVRLYSNRTEAFFVKSELRPRPSTYWTRFGLGRLIEQLQAIHDKMERS